MAATTSRRNRSAKQSNSCTISKRHTKRRRVLPTPRQCWSLPSINHQRYRKYRHTTSSSQSIKYSVFPSLRSSPHSITPSHPHPSLLHILRNPCSKTPISDEAMAHAVTRKYYSRQDIGLLPLYKDRHSDSISRQPLEAATPAAVIPLYVLCIPLHKLSRSMQFMVCVAGVMFFYLLYGYAQEWIFSVDGFKPFGWYLTMIQFAFYSFFGAVERRLRDEGRRRIPLSMYAVLAFLTVSTMGLSNTSLGYLNYPTQVIFKSCKLIPVMIGGVLIQGKKYTIIDGVALVCMSIGLIMFTLADSTLQPEFNKTGVLLISLALCADAVIGNVQEKALKQYSASNLEMVLFSYFIGLWYILIGLVLSGSLLPAFNYCIEHPQVYLMASMFSLTGYLGINFVLVLVRSFGALLAVTVTTFRKAVTMALSFLLFTKPFTDHYIWAGLIVLLGILLNLYSKNKSKVNSGLQYVRLKYLLRRRRSTLAFEV